jgi:hypothetical protein
LTDTLAKQCVKHSSLKPVLPSVVTLVIAIMLTITIAGGSAAALDCLKYKPEGARGQWHADVVSGKICWFGPNWRSFLPKAKPLAESSKISGKDSGILAAKPNLSAEPEPAPNPEASEAEQPKDLPGLRPATPMEAELLINAISMEWDPIQPDVPNPPKPTVARHSMAEMILIISALGIVGIALVTIIIWKPSMRRTKQQLGLRIGAAHQRLDCLLATIPLAPSLQPSAVDDPQLVSVPPWLLRAQT